jgi:hypothetical protein
VATDTTPKGAPPGTHAEMSAPPCNGQAQKRS